jgi:hypothetical protein
MKNQIQTNNVNSTELWVELDEQQSSELSGGSGDINVLSGNNTNILTDGDQDVFDSIDNLNIFSILF